MPLDQGLTGRMERRLLIIVVVRLRRAMEKRRRTRITSVHAKMTVQLSKGFRFFSVGT